MAYLHGVEVRESATGPRPVRTPSTAVIGLVGTAPIWQVPVTERTIDTPVLITSDVEAARFFGSPTSGYTIPAALKGIMDQGAGAVVVVNLFDPSVHKAPVPLYEYDLPASGVLQLPHRGVGNVVVKDEAGAVTHTDQVDYTVDPVAGTITRIAGGAIPPLAAIKVSYDRPFPAAVTTPQVIGGVNSADRRTGMQAWRDAAALLGVAPKLLLAPGYDSQATIVAELLTMAERLRAVALWDVPVGTTVPTVIAGRGPAGTINVSTSSGRGVACYPHVKVLDSATGNVVLAPLAPRLAGVIAARDDQDGYHVSPSNTEIRGIVGMERPLTADFRDNTSDVNRLNEVGVVTIYHGYGTGMRVWGNRTTAWPADTHPRNFIPVRRTADALYAAVEQIVYPYLDRPYTAALMDAIREDVNSYLRGEMAAGRLISGECTVDPALNTPDKVAAGQLTFTIRFMPPTVAERFTVEAIIDTALLSALTPGA